MDLFRFLTLLNGAMRFARVDTFEDKWEGLSRVLPWQPPKERGLAEEQYADFISGHKKWLQRIKRSVFVSCWTLAPESIPLWKIYGSYDAGIAVQSTEARFRRNVHLGGFPSNLAGPVEYYETLPAPDFNYSESVNLSWPLACELHLRKRKCFEFEREWRAVIARRGPNLTGEGPPFNGDKGKSIIVPIRDISDLIERVLVSPLASDSFLKTVETVSQKFGLNVKPKRSRLAQRRPKQTVEPPI